MKLSHSPLLIPLVVVGVIHHHIMSNNNKRRRIAAANGAPQCLVDLPSGILAHAASFLAAPSKALFAVALDKNSAVTSNERSTAIVGNQWDFLDFGEIEIELAMKLSDSDIGKVLLCIDAVNNVKILILTNCTKITGAGLEPLRGSTVIEMIDLSIIGYHRSSQLNQEPKISCDHVLPVLDNVMEVEGCSLRYIEFPFTIREDETSPRTDFHAFVLRYKQMMDDRGVIRCLECNQGLPEDGYEWIETSRHDTRYGTQSHTCCRCLKHYCHGCVINGEEKNMLHRCTTCERNYCEDCTDMNDCHDCYENFICDDCYELGCYQCRKIFCSGCVQGGYGIRECEHCHNRYCYECNDDHEVDILSCCRCCNPCRFQKFKEGKQDCTYCIKQIAPYLDSESLARKQLQEENEQLKAENEELKREIKELKSWNLK